VRLPCVVRVASLTVVGRFITAQKATHRFPKAQTNSIMIMGCGSGGGLGSLSNEEIEQMKRCLARDAEEQAKKEATEKAAAAPAPSAASPAA